jgi:hypothetical protein
LCASATLAPVSGCGTSTFACQTASDECMSDSNCVAPAQCFFDGGKRVCEARPCVTGRPFLVGGIPRTADVTERSDWSTVACAPRIDGLDAELRARLCAEWTRVGLMEHASVAAFARFTLELLALAAPAPLVEASNRALADETVHARLAFGLASAYGGRPIGPGSLDVRGALDIANHRDIVRCVIAEGCLGETIAAAEAVEALDRAKDPAVRRVLARIAADERRHAELAWRFVQWALEHSSLELREAARGGLLEILAGDGVTWEADGTASTCSQNDDAPGGTSAHGILPDSARRDVAARVFTDVVRPCAAALLCRNSQARAA